MGEIINLRRARKVRDQAKAAANAAENRILHGRSKAERARDRRLAEQERTRLDGLRRDDP